MLSSSNPRFRRTMHRWPCTLLCAALGLAVSRPCPAATDASPAWVKEKEKGESQLSLKIPGNLSIQEVVSMLAASGNKSILLGQGLGEKKAAGTIENMSFDQALRSFASANELCVVEKDNCILLVSRQEFMNLYAQCKILPLKRANPEAVAKALGLSAEGQDRPDRLLSVTVDKRTRSLILRGETQQVKDAAQTAQELDRSLSSDVFAVRYASATGVARSVREVLGITAESIGSIIVDARSNQVILHETPENLAIARKIVAQLDVAVESRVFSTGKIDPQVIADQIRQGELGAAQESGGGTTTGATAGTGSGSSSSTADEKVRVVTGTNQIIVTDTPERLKVLEGVMAELNRNIDTRVIQPRNAMPTVLSDLLKTNFPDLSIGVDSRTGSLVVTGHKDRLEEVDKLVAELDTEKNMQVDIEARIMLVSMDKAREYGIRVYGQDLDGLNETLANATVNPNFLADGAKTIGSTMGNPPDASLKNPVKSTSNYLEVLQPNIQVQALVRALESDGDTKILSSPKMRMLVGKTSTIFSGSNEPYRETTFQNNQAVETVKFKDVGVAFEVTPYVSPDQILTLEVSADFSSLREIRDGIPVVDTRQARSTVEAQDGETIFLGGLISQEEGDRKAGLPLLRSIPGLGYLFGDRRVKSIQRELVIVITPRILKPGQGDSDALNGIPQVYSRILNGFPNPCLAPAESKDDAPEKEQ